jgi:D-glycero-D-manno-heptose 1,7-bisphosphate phosphatase
MSRSGRRTVFLDRDGVLNRAIVRNGKPHPPASLDELEIMPEARPALAALRSAGWLLVGVTNQPDVTRGTQRRATVEAINATLLAALPLQDILVCYHDTRDGCECRKPGPGLLYRAVALYGSDLAASVMIGDRWKDVEAGQRAGCATVWIDYGYAEPQPARPADYTARSLGDAVIWVLGPQAAHHGKGWGHAPVE